MFKKYLLAFFLFFAFIHTSHASEKYIFDKKHTSILWFASHIGFSKSHGHFTDFSGYILIDEAAPEKSYVEITIDTASILTGIKKFDDHLISKDFLHSAKFPTAKFVSEKVVITGENEADIHGQFTLLGITKPLILKAKLNKIDKNPFNKKKTVGFSVTGAFDRSEYGMKYAVPMIPANVEIMIEAEAIKATE